MENEENSTIGQEGDSTSWMDVPLGAGTRGDKKKRFNEDQIKSLETMFQNQTKLEPRQKLQLAKELNLEPRQVAIWFQNKRARWKSKKLEREYGVLKSEYDSLLSSFESLKKEKQMLLKKMEKLAELLEKKEPITTIKNDPITPPLGVLSSEEDKSKSTYLSEEGQQDLYTWQRGDEDVQCSLQPTWPSVVVDPLSSGSQHTHSQWWDFWPVNE